MLFFGTLGRVLKKFRRELLPASFHLLTAYIYSSDTVVMLLIPKMEPFNNLSFCTKNIFCPLLFVIKHITSNISLFMGIYFLTNVAEK